MVTCHTEICFTFFQYAREMESTFQLFWVNRTRKYLGPSSIARSVSMQEVEVDLFQRENGLIVQHDRLD